MTMFTPATAILRPLSGRTRFWTLPSPLLIALGIIVLMHFVERGPDSSSNWWVTMVAVLGVALWVYFQAAFFQITQTERDRTENAMRLVSQGNLTNTSDGGVSTLGNFGRHLEIMIANMSSMVANIRTAAVLLGDTGKKLVDDTRSLAERAEAQGQHLQQPLVLGCAFIGWIR